MGLSRLNKKKLKKDESYALNKMAEILSILKNRYAKIDQHWYARYHSQTLKYKNIYGLKVRQRMKRIASVS
jgi:hypothetical protein